MLTKEMAVNLEDFIKYLLKKWKSVILYVGISMILFVMGAKMFGQRIVVEPSERYLLLQEQKKSIEEYIENSPFMEIDPMNINQCRIYLNNISNKEYLKDIIVTGKIWEEMKTEISSKYLVDLIVWNDSEILESVELIVRHSEADVCKEYVNYIFAQIKKFDQKIDVVCGELTVVTEEAVMKEQRRHYKLLDDINSELEYTAAGFTIDVSLKTAAIAGALFGMVFSVAIQLCFFVFKDGDHKVYKG